MEDQSDPSAVRPPSITRASRPATAPSKAPVSVPVEFAGEDAALVTADLLLRPLREADRDPFLETLNESRASLEPFMPLHEPGWTDTDVFERQLAWTLEGLARGTAVRRAVFDQASNKLLGMANLLRIERGLSQRGEINVWIRPTAVGRGVATQAITAVVDDAFDDLPQGRGLHTLSGWRRPENLVSKRILEKLGFVTSGEPLQSVHVGGRWHPHEHWMQTVDRWTLVRDRLAG